MSWLVDLGSDACHRAYLDRIVYRKVRCVTWSQRWPTEHTDDQLRDQKKDHETVGLMLRGGAVPGCTKLACVVRHLVDIAVRQPDVDMTVGKFH